MSVVIRLSLEFLLTECMQSSEKNNLCWQQHDSAMVASDLVLLMLEAEKSVLKFGGNDNFQVKKNDDDNDGNQQVIVESSHPAVTDKSGLALL